MANFQNKDKDNTNFHRIVFTIRFLSLTTCRMGQTVATHKMLLPRFISDIYKFRRGFFTFLACVRAAGKKNASGFRRLPVERFRKNIILLRFFRFRANLGDCRQEHLCIRVRRQIEQRLDIRELDDLSHIHHGSTVAQVINDVQIMGDK